MENELLPCPFCGDEASISEMESRGGGGRIIHIVGCNNDECEVEFPGHARKCDAAKAWNTRTGSPELDRLKKANEMMAAAVAATMASLSTIRYRISRINNHAQLDGQCEACSDDVDEIFNIAKNGYEQLAALKANTAEVGE